MPSPSRLFAFAAIFMSVSAQFTEVFSGLAPGAHDASIEGPAYLTYTVVSNATYNVAACQDWCLNNVAGCVFVNLYYEFNNELLDFVFSQQSNLKCAAYSAIYSASDKTNFGGQASYPQVGTEPVPLTYITQSSGWALTSYVNPDAPDGYELVFGPTGGANNAPGYMGFTFLDTYDVDACASLCNTRGADPVGGVCKFFNIWRAVVSGVPTTYTCSMYFTPTDASTAVNFGQGDLVVTLSRGYKRVNVPTPPTYSRRAVHRATPTGGRRLKQATLVPRAPGTKHLGRSVQHRILKRGETLRA
ncbi:hypothetical protein B0H11DRAFT_2132482 [Mycena galericulata]|nr:hypothetical protein B0H11DRAFT_2132482 [Mycena galericulata]